MQEQHRLAVRPDLRVAVAQDPGALGLQLVAGGEDIVDLEADVMNAAVRVALQELRNRRGLAERLQEFTDTHPEFETAVERFATWLARHDDPED